MYDTPHHPQCLAWSPASRKLAEWKATFGLSHNTGLRKSLQGPTLSSPVLWSPRQKRLVAKGGLEALQFTFGAETSQEGSFRDG